MFALIGAMGTEPCLIDKALCRPNAKAWQEVLDYEIGQLKKLQIWVIKDCLNGEPIIPCTKVLKEKHGPTSEIEKYHVCIMAGGHKQVEGINYSKTFSTAVKMPSVCIILANTAEKDWKYIKLM